jgi:antirestriction protein ArdC
VNTVTNVGSGINKEVGMHISERITSMILKKLEQGVIPWHQPWSYDSWPRNPFTQNHYRGINIFILLLAMYPKPFWMTFGQIDRLGGHVKANEKGMPIVYWKLFEIKKKDEDEQYIPLMKYYTVFNIEQCSGIDSSMFEKKEIDFIPLQQCEKVVKNMPQKPIIKHNGGRAYYNCKNDIINLPPANTFRSNELYYSTLFHELIHSTGHARRLNRKSITEAVEFGSTNYSKEELIAEMGSSFLCAHCQIENQTIDNSTAYISNWIEQFKDKKLMIITAAAQAQKAYEYIVKAS